MEKITKNTKKSYKPMAIATLFCVAAGVYAADDGWQYKDAEKTIIENTGLGTEKRSTALQKGETLNIGEEIENVSNVEVAGTADFASDKDSLNAIVLDSEKQNVAMADGSSINVEASTIADQRQRQ